MTQLSSEKSSQGYVAVTSPCVVRLVFGVAYENRLVICLHCLFSLANPDGGITFHIYYSAPLCSSCSDVDGVILCLSQNLCQHGTITVNLANVYKVQSRAAGLCSQCLVFLRLCFLFHPPTPPPHVFYVRVCVRRERVYLKSTLRACLCGGEELGVSWRSAAVQGGGVFNKCMLMLEAATMRGMRGLCCYLLLCLCTAANPGPANGITARDE